MKIKVEKEYVFKPKTNNYECNVIVFLKGNRETIDDLFKNQKVFFFEQNLNDSWKESTNGEKEFYMKLIFWDNELESLKERVSKYIKKEITKLRKVVKQNNKMIRKVRKRKTMEKLNELPFKEILYFEII